MSFFLFGRPRSRTAWCANFLTTNESFCYHEPFADVRTVRDLARQFSQNTAIATGAADTSLIHRPHEILHAFPDARIVLLTGSGPSWRRFSQDRLRLPLGVTTMVEDDYQRTKALLGDRALHINVQRLMTDESTARRLWFHCTGRSLNFDRERYLMLRDLNIQVTGDSLERRLAESLGG